MHSLFDGLLVSCPNDGGLFLVHGGKASRLDSLSCTGVDVSGDSVLRGLQSTGLALTGKLNWSRTGDVTLFDDVHDVLLDGELCYVVGTTGNEVVCFNEAGTEMGRWAFSQQPDSWHLNCLARWKESIVFSAFGMAETTRGYKGNTQGAGFVQDLFSGQKYIEGLSQPHSLVPHGENLLLANSECKEVREYSPDGALLRTAVLDGYTRGICVVGDLLYVGLSCSRNIDDTQLSSATVVALDIATWAERGRISLNALEIYSIVSVVDTDVMLRALGPLSESIVDRLTSLWRDSRGLAIRLEQRVVECDEQLQEKDRLWNARFEQETADHAAQIQRIADECESKLAAKDETLVERVEQIAIDHVADIQRLAYERDLMLSEKDQVWSERLVQIAAEHVAEIQRISHERDMILRDKDQVWSARQDHFNYVEARRTEMLKRLSPNVSVVTVNYNGKAFLRELIASLLRQTYIPAEIIVVDNASNDGSVEFLREEFPSVKVLRSEVNLGFAGGNNLGVSAATSPLLALINNDTVVSDTWLEGLVGTWTQRTAAGERVGAVSPKIVYFKRFLQVRLRAPTQSPGGGDGRMLGVAIDLSETAFVGVSYTKPIVGQGFYHEERWSEGRIVRWTGEMAELMLPVGEAQLGGPLTLRIVATTVGRPEGVPLEVECDGQLLGTCLVREGFAEFQFDVPGDVSNNAKWVVNNAGSALDGRGNAADIGINQSDAGQFDQPRELDAFCGCSVLMSRMLFVEHGGFDERFFMYYEDADLSWRIRKAGWKILFEPQSVVRHIHAGSSGEWSPSFRYHVTRNYWLNAFKNAGPSHLAVQTARFIRVLARAVRGNRRAGLLSWRGKSLNEMTPQQIELKALLKATLMIPAILGMRLRTLMRKDR
ncbi:glycosyltransferase [Pseudomonas weihenstephanensis]|uniref:glycosyltransferase n=1 Tax=Pseudomonas weihenstephanensis TaxID=1608994 RepID=UPI0006543E05|nr:glycosyltransferase [Pseudomonas weihenstephanensis]KMN16118.1 group 2 family glycosyltransferase [Pseudomonas weihenstephanensis]